MVFAIWYLVVFKARIGTQVSDFMTELAWCVCGRCGTVRTEPNVKSRSRLAPPRAWLQKGGGGRGRGVGSGAAEHPQHMGCTFHCTLGAAGCLHSPCVLGAGRREANAEKGVN